MSNQVENQFIKPLLTKLAKQEELDLKNAVIVYLPDAKESSNIYKDPFKSKSKNINNQKNQRHRETLVIATNPQATDEEILYQLKQAISETLLEGVHQNQPIKVIHTKVNIPTMKLIVKIALEYNQTQSKPINQIEEVILTLETPNR